MVTISNARSVIASAVCVGVVAAGITLVAQTPAAKTPETPTQEIPRLRISTTLVEIDAMVTDRDGRHVTDLKPEDFELIQDGRPQKISSVRYVSLDARGPASGGDEDIRRTVAIVIDTLNMSFTSMAYTRQALLRFVDTQIEPGDRVAIIDMDHNGGRYEDFTGNARELRKKVEALRYSVMSAAQMPHGRMHNAYLAFDPREENFTVGTLGTVNQLVRGMKKMPGRKAVVLATDGFSILERDAVVGDGLTLRPRVTQAIKQLADDANRSFVVLHAVDTRRLAPVDIATPIFDFDASSGIHSGPNTGTLSRLADFDGDGPALLAQSGGGLYLRNSNDLTGLFTKVMNDQRGYYLLAYEPDDQTFTRDKKKRPTFHGVKVKVSRPDTRVRSRAGFFGVADEDLRPAEPARAFAGS